MISALCQTTDMSVTVLPMALEVTRLFSGFFLAPSRLPKYFTWLDALSYVKYSFVGASLNEFQGLRLSCANTRSIPVNATYSIAKPCIETGEYFITERGYDYLNIWTCVGILFAIIIFCRFCAFIGVRFLKN